MFGWLSGLRGFSASSSAPPTDVSTSRDNSLDMDSVIEALNASAPEPSHQAVLQRDEATVPAPAPAEVPVVAATVENKPPTVPVTTTTTVAPPARVPLAPFTITPAPVIRMTSSAPEAKGPEGDAIETPNNAEQEAIARALLRQTPVDDLSEMFKNSSSLHSSAASHHHVSSRPAMDEPVSTHEQQLAVVKREASILRFRELWEVLPPSIPSRHPLHSRWVLWFLKGDRTKDWEECLRKVTVFDSIEGFWSVANHIISPSQLSWGSDFYVFREGVRPMWEDDHNVKGGRWLVYVEKAKRAQVLDHYWMELLFALVGEQFGEDGACISGAVVNIRQKGDKVALWTHDATKDAKNYRIGKVLYDALGINDGEVMRYEVHKDASVRTGSTVKPRIVLPLKYMKNLTAQQLQDLSVATGEVAAPPVVQQSKYMYQKHYNPNDGHHFDELLTEALEVQAVLK